MSTPMISNLKKLHDQATDSDPEDPTVYSQIIESLIYLVLKYCVTAKNILFTIH
jgi:hypothetical protein